MPSYRVEGGDAPPIFTLLVHRRLDETRCGSGVYLLGLIDRVRAAGFDLRIVMAPAAGFGSLPFSRPAQIFCEMGCRMIWPSAIRLGPVFVSTNWAVWKRFLHRSIELAVWALIRRRKTDRPAFQSSLGKAPTAADLELLVAAANEVASTMVIAEYSSLAPVLSRCRAEVRAALLHDVFSFRTDSFQEMGLPSDHAEVVIDTELAWLDAVDLCLYASASEAVRMESLLPEKRHIWLPPRVRRQEVVAGDRPRAVFLGVRHGGNQDALDMILSKIWPRVRQALPDAELWIVGEIGESVRDAPDGVRVLGRIENLAYIGGADAVGLAPNRVASGVSIKIATYLELGMSVLTSPKALEGYCGALDGLVVQADGAAEFSAKLIELLSDAQLRADLARRGSQNVAARLDSNGFERYLSALDASPLDGERAPTEWCPQR